MPNKKQQRGFFLARKKIKVEKTKPQGFFLARKESNLKDNCCQPKSCQVPCDTCFSDRVTQNCHYIYEKDLCSQNNSHLRCPEQCSMGSQVDHNGDHITEDYKDHILTGMGISTDDECSKKGPC